MTEVVEKKMYRQCTPKVVSPLPENKEENFNYKMATGYEDYTPPKHVRRAPKRLNMVV